LWIYIQARPLERGPKGPHPKGRSCMPTFSLHVPLTLHIFQIYIQARPLERGPLRAPIQGDGLVCLVFNEYLSVQEVSSLEL